MMEKGLNVCLLNDSFPPVPAAHDGKMPALLILGTGGIYRRFYNLFQLFHLDMPVRKRAGAPAAQNRLHYFVHTLIVRKRCMCKIIIKKNRR